MASKEKDVEAYLAVGCPVVFCADAIRRSAPRYTTVIRGWRKPAYVLLDTPRISGRTAVVRENQACSIQYVKGGHVCVFDSVVFDWDTRQVNSYCRIAWPKCVNTESFRKHERLPLDAPCKVYVQDEVTAGRMLDVSIGGGRIVTSMPVAVESIIEVTCTLPNNTLIERARGVVKNTRQAASGRHEAGFEFLPGQVRVENDIAFFVITTKERSGAKDKERKRVLVVDREEGGSSVLRKLLENRGYEVILAKGVVDGCFRLQMAMPDVLLIDQKLKEMDGVELCRVVHESAEFRSLPIYVFGESEGEAEEHTARAGGKGYVSSTGGPGALIKAVITAIGVPAEVTNVGEG